MPIFPAPGVTQVEAFRESKDEVSWTARYNAAWLTAERTKWSFYVKWMFKWREEKERELRDRLRHWIHKERHVEKRDTFCLVVANKTLDNCMAFFRTGKLCRLTWFNLTTGHSYMQIPANAFFRLHKLSLIFNSVMREQLQHKKWFITQRNVLTPWLLHKSAETRHTDTPSVHALTLNHLQGCNSLFMFLKMLKIGRICL